MAEGVYDTGRTIKAFLPISAEQNRSRLHTYSDGNCLSHNHRRRSTDETNDLEYNVKHDLELMV